MLLSYQYFYPRRDE